MSSFRDLQKIYEDYRGMSFNPNPNKAYTAEPSKYSYRGSLPFNAGGADNAYARAALNVGPVIADDEEDAVVVVVGAINKSSAIDKINDLMKMAESDDMMYAVHLLGQLKEFIKSN